MKFFIIFFLPIFLQTNLIINHQYSMGHISITYGSYMDDAYMMISDTKSGEVYNEIILDEGGQESFVFLGEVNHQEYIMVLETYSMDTDEYHYSLLLYNIYGEMMNRKNLIEKVNDFHNLHHTLIIETDEGYKYISNDLLLQNDINKEMEVTGDYHLQYQGQAFVNDQSVETILINQPGVYEIKIIDDQYIYQELVTVHPLVKIAGQQYKDGYLGDISIKSKGEVLVNDKQYKSGDALSSPGLYDVDISGVNGYSHSFSFKIYPHVIFFDGDDQFELREGMVFDFPISIYADVDEILINGHNYQNGLITEANDYLIEFMVDDKLIDTMNISFVSSVKGVQNNQKYDMVKIYAFGQVYLNEEKIVGFHYIRKPGTYHINVLKQDGTYEDIVFYINGSSEEENSSLLPYGILVISFFGFLIILFKK